MNRSLDLIDWQLITSPQSAPLYLIVGTEPEVDDATYVAMRNTGLLTRLLRGNRCASRAGLFQEFAAALQFPHYFGHNWDAFDECINDLSWQEFDSCVLILTQGDRFLEENEDDFGLLLRLLVEAAGAWSGSQHGSSRVSRPRVFRAALNVEPDREALFLKRLDAFGTRVARFR